MRRILLKYKLLKLCYCQAQPQVPDLTYVGVIDQVLSVEPNKNFSPLFDPLVIIEAEFQIALHLNSIEK